MCDLVGLLTYEADESTVDHDETRSRAESSGRVREANERRSALPVLETSCAADDDNGSHKNYHVNIKNNNNKKKTKRRTEELNGQRQKTHENIQKTKKNNREEIGSDTREEVGGRRERKKMSRRKRIKQKKRGE